MKNKVSEKVSKVIIKAAVETANMPNQVCPFLFGEPHSDLAINSSDYKNMVAFMKNRNQ